MLIVCSIAYMIVNKNIRIEVMKNFFEGQRFFRITFYEITVEIKVFRNFCEAFSLGTVLIDTIIRTSIQTSTNIVNRDDRKNHVPTQLVLFLNKASIPFSRVNFIINKMMVFLFALMDLISKSLSGEIKIKYRGKPASLGPHFHHFY